MTPTEKYLVAFLCLLLACCLGLGGAIIWLNASKPLSMIEACPTGRKP